MNLFTFTTEEEGFGITVPFEIRQGLKRIVESSIEN